MARLTDLPVETINNICVFLRHLYSDRYGPDYTPAAKKGLASLCRTSRQFYSIALPHLYHHVNINDNEARVIPFTRTLFDNQALADLVREIDLEQCFRNTIDPTLKSYFLSRPLTSMPLYHLENGLSGYADDHAIRALGILLTRLRKLRSIDFVAQNTHFAHTVFTPIKEKCLHDLEFRTHFREVTLRCRDTHQPLDLSSLVPFISSTSIQKLAVVLCTNIEGYPHCSLPSLLEARLLNSLLTFEDFESLVRWCPNLELLRYELGGMLLVDEDQDLASSLEITRAIAPLCKTLRTLILHQDAECICDPDDGIDAIGSLTNFDKLKNLVITFHDLTGEDPPSDEEDSEDWEIESCSTEEDLDCWDCSYMSNLPRSLENLCIVNAQPSLIYGLLKLGKIAKDQTPNLKTLIVDESFDLKSLFSELGVNYQEFNHATFMNPYRGLEEFCKRCWQQLNEGRGRHSEMDIALNKYYTKSILPYRTSSANRSTTQLAEGSEEAKRNG